MGIKRVFSAVLAAVLLLVSLPSEALAADSGTPELTALTVRTESGEQIELLGQESVTADLGASYSFTATFDHADQIDSVYITSTKGSAVRMLEAHRNGASFTTSGWFNGDKDYIPGKIGVQYTMKTKQTSMDDEVDWNALKIKECTAEITSSSGQLTEANVDLTALLGAESQVAVDLAVDIFDETTGGNLNEWLGVYQELELMTKYTLDGGKYVLYLDYSDPSTYAMILRDVSGSKYVKTLLKEAGEYSDNLRTLSEKLGKINSVSSLTYQFLTIQDNADQLREQVSGRTDLTGEEKGQLRESIDAFESDQMLFTLTMTVLPAVVTAVSGGTMAGPVPIFNALVGALNASADYFWDHRMGMYDGCDPLETNFISGAHGIQLTNSELRKINYTLAKGGTYYLTESVSSAIRIDGANVTICKHGFGCKLINDGGSLEVCDCTYEEDLDGNMIGQSLYATVTNNGGTVQIDGGLFAPSASDDVIQNNGGTVIINAGMFKGADTDRTSGTVGAAVRNGAGGTMTIFGGTFVGGSNAKYTGSAISNAGTLTIWFGDFLCGGTTAAGTCISNSGVAEIFDGQFVGSISNSARESNGGLTIHDGTFQAANKYNVGNSWGTVVIENRDFQMLGVYETDRNIYTSAGNANAQLKTVIRGGTFYCEGGSCVESQRGTSLMPVPYTVIEGGSFYSTEDGCVSSSGALTISGGAFLNGDPPAFSGCVTNWGEGVLDISGGTFTCLEGGPCVYSDDNPNVTISGGTFLAPEGLSVVEGKGCTLLVGENGDIEMTGRFGLFREDHRTDEFQLTVSTPAGYNGGIVYYDEPEENGVAVTAAQLMAMDFSREKYLRLVGDVSLGGTSPEGVSVSLSGSGEDLRTAKVSDPNQVLTSDTLVWAASYEDGKMTGITSGILKADGTVRTATFSEPVEAGAVLFFLDGENKPMCGNILLQPGKMN